MSLPVPASEGRLADNILHFVHALRRAGVRVGTSQVETAVAAVAVAGFSRRSDFRHILRATLITRAGDLEVFERLFALFWRTPAFLESLMHMLSPQIRDETPPPPARPADRRAADALGAPPPPAPRDAPPRDTLLEAATFTWSDRDVLRRRDFDQMSAQELAEAAAAIRDLRLPAAPLLTRRQQPAANGRPDPRRTLQQAIRRGGELGQIARRAARTRPPDLVVLCDISGSMATYARMILRFVHAVAHAPAREWGQVHAFTFGTRLSDVTRALRQSDPDAALAAIGKRATDWEGGTRIGPALRAFNREAARRVLGRGAVVLLVTDGLERGDPAQLRAEAEHLARRCRSLIWLNPLLRFDGFAPRAGGIRALLPAVTRFHACHSLDSLAALSDALGAPDLRAALLRDMGPDRIAPGG